MPVPRLPRLRIAHQLSLLLTSAVVLAVLAVGTLTLWNLRSGFGEYTRQRDEEQLTRFVQLVELRASASRGMDWLTDDHEAMRELMDEFNGRPPRARRPQPPPLGQDELRPPPPPPPRPAPGPSSGLAERLVIRDMQGQQIAGRRQPPGARVTVRAVKVDGLEVATVELTAEPGPEGLDARFLNRQTKGLIAITVATLIFTGLIGWWVAGRWSRPLRELQMATRRISKGDKTVRIALGDGGSAAVEIDDLISDVNAMAISLEALENARRTWIAQISHELRTPLSVLRGELESIEDGVRQPTREVIISLRDEVAQLNRLVDDLHTLTVADLGQMPCEFARGEANEALIRMSAKFQARATQLGLRLIVSSPGGPISAHWDFGRIEQMMSNLLENSLRYTTAPGSIEVTWKTNLDTLQLVIDDSAPSVSPQDMPKLFDPLFRVDAARTRTGQHGSGMGLSVVLAIAKAHRGSAEAFPSHLGGLRMVIHLPLSPERLERRKRAT